MIKSLDCIIQKMESYYRILRERTIWLDMFFKYIIFRIMKGEFEYMRVYEGNVNV